MARPLTEDEKATFEAIRTLPGEEIALVQTRYEGEETAVICQIVRHGEMVDVLPVALLITDVVWERLESPSPDVEVIGRG